MRIRALLRQVGWAFLTLFVISAVTFGAVNVGRSPTDIARQALGRQATEGALAAYVEANRLDAPIIERYGTWLSDLAQGDWGSSPVTGRDVRADVVPRLIRSVILAMASLTLALPVSLALGVYMARRVGRISDLSLGMGLVTLSALPEFVIGIALLLIFAVHLGVLPTGGAGIHFGGLQTQAAAYVLPAMTLAIAVIPYVARTTRAAVRETLASSYTQAAVLRGLRERTVVWDFAVRNAALPIVNAVALNVVYLLGGVVVVENVFGFPGVGQALVQAILRGDVITVQAIGVVLGATFIAISLIADVFAIYFNPRLRAAGSE